jgi:hypothetical protein
MLKKALELSTAVGPLYCCSVSGSWQAGASLVLVELGCTALQEQTAFGRPHAGRGGNATRHNGHNSMGFGGAGASPFAAVAGPPPSAGHSAGSFGNASASAPHQPGFFVGSPPSGFGLPMPFGPSHSAGVPPVATTTGFPAPAFFPQASHTFKHLQRLLRKETGVKGHYDAL